jgi:phosphoribosylamine--glycine ligase
MKILVVGGGGREHALVWKLRQSPRVEQIWCAPGNGGISEDAECVAGDPGEVASLVTLAENLKPDLTIVGPELPLVHGIADAFAQRNWPIIAPSQEAAQLEGSKVFAKKFLLRHNIATARMYGAYDLAREALAALNDVSFPLVIKADGLCAGKGVVLPADHAEASDFIERAMVKDEFGSGGRKLLLEETLLGEELSFIILTDGEHYAPFVPTRDHKRAFDGDQGPNTGGMGAYSNDELLPNGLREDILRHVVEPTLRGLAASGPKVLEFNCRLGDPEAQAIVARMDFDLAEVLSDTVAGRLDSSKLLWKAGASVCVVLASGGYPGKFNVDNKITGLTGIDSQTGVKVFHAGTKCVGDSVVTSGGRVLGVTAAARSVEAALAKVYQAIGGIHFEGMHYRKDIAAKANRVVAGGD